MLDVEAGIRRPKIDVHAHVWPSEGEEGGDLLVATADLFHVAEVWCSAPITGGRIGSDEEVRANNDVILRAMQRHPGRVRGYCFTIPGPTAPAEARRCLDAGMIGIKLYNQYKIQDPVTWPLLELAIEYGVPVLVHAAYLPVAEHAALQPLTSHGADFAEASRRYPEAMLIHAHIGGGGDWEWTVRAMREGSPNLCCDVSGSNLDAGQVEYAVAQLGARRVLFGSDGTMEGCVGKVIGARLTEAERELIFRGNAMRMLQARKKPPSSGPQPKGGAAGDL